MDAPRGRGLLGWWEALNLTAQTWQSQMGDEAWATALHTQAYWLDALRSFALDHGSILVQAIACYEAALRVYTEEQFPRDWASTNYNLALVFRLAKRYKDGCSRLQQVVNSQQDNQRALYLLACLLALDGEWEEALQRLAQVVERNPRYRATARDDEDFVALREDERFRGLVRE